MNSSPNPNDPASGGSDSTGGPTPAAEASTPQPKAKGPGPKPKSTVATSGAPWYSSILKIFGFAEFNLVLIILILGVVLTKFGGNHTDFSTGATISNFLNAKTLFLVATNTSFFAIMAVGANAVIVTAGIDLSVGSVTCLAAVSTAIVLQGMVNAHMTGAAELITVAIVCSLGVGALCGLINGLAVVLLDVHPFVITLGTLWIVRGIAFILTKAQSILIPTAVMNFVQNPLGLSSTLTPVPLIVTLGVAFAGWVFMSKTPMGRRIFAVGGNLEASRYSGIPVSRVLVGVYVIAGLTAGIAAFLSAGIYGAASSVDATGYELYVIAATVVGGTSLFGGRGTVPGAVLGALLIELIRESIVILHLDSNYQQIIVGFAIIAAVVFDRAGDKMRRRKMVMAQAKVREAESAVA